MKMDRIGASIREAQKTPGIRELMADKEQSLNLAVLAEEELRNAPNVVSAAGPVAPTRAPLLTSLAAKLNTLALGGGTDVQLTLEEQKELMPLMGKYQRGMDLVRQGTQLIPDEDLETVVRAIALHPGESDIAGILAMDDSRAKERVARALKILAFKDPGQYAAVINNLSTSREFLKKDWRALESIFEVTGKYGIDHGTVMQCLDRDDWVELLTSAAAARMQGRPSYFQEVKSGLNQLGFRHELALIQPIVNRYQTFSQDRLRVQGEVSNALRSVFMQEGVAGSVLMQEALEPNAPAESKSAYDSLRNAQNRVSKLMSDGAAFTRALQTDLSADPLWAHRADPAVSEQLASNWLENRYQGDMKAASTERGFWRALWGFLSSMSGIAYSKTDIQRAAQQIRGI